MIKLEPGDLRRAAALAVHLGHGDQEGAQAVFEEADDAQRLIELTVGVATVYGILVPLLHTEAGLVLLRKTITDMAAQEDGDHHE